MILGWTVVFAEGDAVCTLVAELALVEVVLLEEVDGLLGRKTSLGNVMAFNKRDGIKADS